jgi:hypothetical protein
MISNSFLGLGKNQPSRKSLQLGENTIQVCRMSRFNPSKSLQQQSFVAASNLGANYIEVSLFFFLFLIMLTLISLVLAHPLIRSINANTT